MNENENQSTLYSNSLGKVDKSYLGSKISSKIVESKGNQIDAELLQYEAHLSKIAEDWQKIQETRKISQSELRAMNEMSILSKQISEFEKTKNKDAEEYVRLVEDYAKVALKNEELIFENRQKNNELLGDALDQESEHIADLRSSLKYIVKDSKDFAAHMENAGKKGEYLKSNLKNLSDSLGKLSMVTGLDSIKKELQGQSSNSWVDLRNRTSMNMGMTSSGEWERFKNTLVGNVQSMNSNLGKMMYGSDDIKNYMANLSNLGIYDTKMAEAQLQAVIEGNKIAGMSYETQSAILKIGRRTDNQELLGQVNKTIATLLNAQIGLSKEQLAKMTEQSVANADVLSFLGNPQAINQLTTGKAFLESEYGAGTGDAAENILTDLLNNGVDSKYYAALGGNDIINLAQQDAGKALELIVKRAQQSNIMNTASNGVYTMNALGNLGVDGNTRALNQAKGKTGKSYDQFLEETSKNGATLNDIAANQWVPLEEQIKNYLGLITANFPTLGMFTFQNAFYVATLAQIAIQIKESFKQTLLLGKIAGDTKVFGKNATGMTDFLKGTGKFGGLVDKVAGIAGIVSLIAGSIMFIKDFVGGWKDTEKYGNKDTLGGKIKSGLAQGIYGDMEGSSSNALKNAIKWGLIGAGIGTIVPGIGNLAGFLIGGAAGLLFGGITGSLGAKNGVISNAFGLVNSNKEDAKGEMAGRGGSGAMGSYPWTRTSPFGYRTHPVTGKRGTFHNGVDLASRGGTPIGANYGGVVDGKGVDSYGANYVSIKDAAGRSHKYWHLQAPSPLTKGQTVFPGQLIGLMGTTGLSTGNHLHYAIRVGYSGNGEKDYVNPEPYINNTLFNVSESAPIQTERVENLDTTPDYSRKLVSSNTTQTDAVLARYTSMGAGSPDVVESVNSGFSNLINKLEEISSRQDKTEEMLKMIAIPSGTSAYRY